MTGTLVLSLISGFFLSPIPDLYYQMNAANLNTMNSYVIPAETKIDPTSYPSLQYRIKELTWDLQVIQNFDGSLDGGLEDWFMFHVMSTYPWVMIVLLLIMIIGLVVRYLPNSSFALLFSMLYEWIWDFFENILWKGEKLWIKHYVVSLFFIILISNLLGVFNDIIRFFFPWILRNITAPTGEFEFNIGLALIAVIITLMLQFKNLGLLKFFHEYIPITGKWLLEWKWIGAKIGDIIISLFIGLLDIIWIFAKIISLSMRLFGNMSAGWILLNIAFLWLWGVTTMLIGFNFPVLVPLIVYCLSLLSSVVQALVFSLLVAIFIKLANEWETMNADEDHY